MDVETVLAAGPTRVEQLEAEVERLRREVERLSLFHDVGKELASTFDLSRILQTIMEKISELLEPDSWSLLLLDEATQELYFEIAIGEGAENLREVRVPVGHGIAGWAAASRESVLVEDVSADPRFASQYDELTGTKTRSVVCVPIVARDRVLGVIELINFVEHPSFRRGDLPILTNLADYAAIAIENARYVKRIHDLTITDDCTTLYNARHLNFVMDAEIYRSGRYGYHFSVIFLDLDHFKDVNDTHGHVVGSRLLHEIGELLKGHIRMIDTAFRYGGDEFVLLLPQTPKEEALRAGRRLRDLLSGRRFQVGAGLEVPVTASFGVASFPVDGRSRKELLAAADEAMYAVKARSRNDIAVA